MADNTKNKQQNIGGELFHIGNYLGLREEIDPNFKVTKLIRNNLSVVDIIPVDYSLNWTKIGQKNGFAITYDFEKCVDNYRQRCEFYKLKPYDGLRLWLTDDTQAYEEISNSFENNVIESKANDLAQTGVIKAARDALKAFNVNQDMTKPPLLTQYVTEPLANFSSGALGIPQDSIGPQILKTVSNTVEGMLLQGKQVSLPKIWRQSDYNPSLTLNVKLVSPYGHPEAIKNFITRPLVYLLLMGAPESQDGLTYGLYQPIKIKAYGINNINLGAITSISLRRGGRETAYNVYRQPLQIDVAINCIPLSPGFAHMGRQVDDVATMNEASLPYEENAKGSPAFTTVGNIIQSLRPVPQEILAKTVGTTSSSYNNPDLQAPASTTPPAASAPNPSNSLPKKENNVTYAAWTYCNFKGIGDQGMKI